MESKWEGQTEVQTMHFPAHLRRSKHGMLHLRLKNHLQEAQLVCFLDAAGKRELQPWLLRHRLGWALRLAWSGNLLDFASRPEIAVFELQP